MKVKNIKPLVISGVDVTKAQLRREACEALRHIRAVKFELKANKRVQKINKNNYLNYI